MWTTHMQNGDFEAAWKVSDQVLRERANAPCWHLPRHMQYVWDGTPLSGKRVLVRCYHGLGDTIQFIRYAPLVKEVAATVTVWAQPELIPLLATMPGVDRLLPLTDGTPGIDFDIDVEIMELPYIFRTTLDSVPAVVPYLHVEPATLAADCRLKVGLVWCAGDWDPRRSLPFSLLAPVTEILEISYVIFQRGPALAEMPEGFGTLSNGRTILEMAAALRSVDLLISVDTMAAHLAGALGIPVWTLLHRDADWRWLIGREDTPWYPTMRLWRQERAGEWGPVIARVAGELARLVPDGLKILYGGKREKGFRP